MDKTQSLQAEKWHLGIAWVRLIEMMLHVGRGVALKISYRCDCVRFMTGDGKLDLLVIAVCHMYLWHP